MERRSNKTDRGRKKVMINKVRMKYCWYCGVGVETDKVFHSKCGQMLKILGDKKNE